MKDFEYLFKKLPIDAWDMDLYQLQRWHKEIVEYEMTHEKKIGYKYKIEQAIQMKKSHELGLWLFIGAVGIITITFFVLCIM